MTIAIYLAHLNPVTNAHSEIIKDLTKSDEVVVMPVRFLIDGNEVNSKSFPFTFELNTSIPPLIIWGMTALSGIVHGNFQELSK